MNASEALKQGNQVATEGTLAQCWHLDCQMSIRLMGALHQRIVTRFDWRLVTLLALLVLPLLEPRVWLQASAPSPARSAAVGNRADAVAGCVGGIPRSALGCVGSAAPAGSLP